MSRVIHQYKFRQPCDTSKIMTLWNILLSSFCAASPEHTEEVSTHSQKNPETKAQGFDLIYVLNVLKSVKIRQT